MKKRSIVALMCAPAVMYFAAPTMAQQYTPGFEWNRSANWVPGSIAGSSAGNPQPDGEGSAAWQAEWTQGGPMGSSNEWFAQPGQLMVWDPDWYGIGSGGAWVKGDNVNPPIFNNRMTHNIHSTAYSAIPMMRWINPVGDNTVIDIAGTLDVTWSGHEFFGVPVEVDVVIAVNDFSTGVTSVLVGETLSKATPFPSVGDSSVVDVSLGQVVMDEGDSLIFSLRARDSFDGDGRWIVMQDNVTITLTPTPGASVLLGIAGLAAIRRRKR
jgi:hypothetical protein